MKIIHLSDPHIFTDKIHGIDPVDRFKKALDHINTNHNNADLFVITGDITDQGDKESYQLFQEIVDSINLPKNLEPKLIIGNHDNRKIFKDTFSFILLDNNGFIQYCIDIEDNKFIFLDTNLEGTDQGHFCNQRQQWLINKLEEGLEKNIYLFMHHNPLPTGHIKSDGLGLQQIKEFKKILIKYKETIKHIFFGHQHITTSGKYLGITFSSPRSTWSPLIPNFSETFRLGTAYTDPNYNVILLQKDSLIVHSEDFLKAHVDWLGYTIK